ncbi:alcohol dehydrogenase catalytic domain-containing protein [Rhodococcus sp. NPDC058521]|uniref:alcohol dehydrogenase catalytic domain-containing protein n=1 Tax=Rhodococcus sp. NPDC058521 TaxID=3346536 RepID=UPI003656374B
MYAVRVHEYGGPEVLVHEEVPDPVAGPGQVVVGVSVADVMFLDTLLRGGWGGEVFPRDLPYVPGGGGAGEVLSVGAGVDPAWVGRKVVARTTPARTSLQRREVSRSCSRQGAAGPMSPSITPKTAGYNAFAMPQAGSVRL